MENYYFNTETNDALSKRIVNVINGAKKYVKTGNFFFREEKIINALKAAAMRGVAVFVLSNLHKAEEQKAEREFSRGDNDPHLSNLYELVKCGVHVRCVRELHAKFLLADGVEGLVMSANYTYESLWCNPENGVDLRRKEIWDLERVFDTIYTYADFQLVRDKSRYMLAIKNSVVPVGTFNCIGQNSKLLMTLIGKKEDEKGRPIKTNFSECKVSTLYDTIIDVINEANKDVCILSYSFVALDKLPELEEALVKASLRGANILLLYRDDAEKCKVEKWEKQLDELREKIPGGAKKVGIHNNHAKCILTEHLGLLFTGNIDGDNGMKSGFELGVYLDEVQRVDAWRVVNEMYNQYKK